MHIEKKRMSELSSNKPNFFELLELDPNARWDEALFESRLTQKRNEWTMKTRHPREGHLYQSYLELIEEMRAALTDPNTRAQLAKEAIARQKQQTQQLQILFNQHLEMLEAKGFATEEDVQGLVKEYGSILNENEIRATLKRRKIEVRSHQSEQQASAEQVKIKNMREMLKMLGKRDLYDFLDMSPKSATKALYEKAQEIYQEAQKKVEKNAEVTATSTLAGYAMDYFRDNQQRRKYEQTLEEEPYERILGEPLKRTLSNGEKMLYATQMQRLLEKARSEGLDLKRAQEYIIQQVRQLGASYEVVDVAPIQAKQRCPICQSLNDTSAEVCHHCGTPLKIECPSCQQTISTEHNFCPHCNFAVGNLLLIEQQLKAAFDLLRARRYDLADKKFQEAWHLWEQLPQRPTHNPIIRKIEQQFEEAQEELDWQHEKITQLKTLIDQKRFYAAREVLRELQEVWYENVFANEEKQITTAIADVEQRLKVARAADPDEALQLYMDILQDCVDCKAARDALGSLPPTPPSDLMITSGRGVIRLDWQPSTSKNTRHAIVRKVGARPVSAKDGILLDTISGSTYDDADPPNGLPLYYAVYAEREGIYSEHAAATDTPIMLMASVRDLTANVDDRRVALRWAVPDNVSAVSVRRGQAGVFPTNPQEGEAVSTLSLTEAIDTELENNTTYYYSVFALYEDAEGRLVASPPTSITAVPQQPPTFITDVQTEVVRTGITHVIRLHFTPPPKGEAVIILTEKMPNFYTYQILPKADVTDIGNVLYGTNGVVETEVESAKLFYLTPVVLFGDMAYIGPTINYASLEDVKNLQVRNIGNAIQLSWEWPRNCEKVIVAYRNDGYPTAEQKEGTVRHEVTRAQYQRRFFTLESPPQADYYFRVFAIISQDGQTLTSSGYNASAHIRYSHSLEIRYHVQKRRGLGGSKYFAVIDFIGDGLIPEIVLVRHAFAPPHRRDAGETVLIIPPDQVQRKSHRVEIPPQYCEPNMYLGLFLVDEDAYESRGGHVHILNPSLDQLKLF